MEHSFEPIIDRRSRLLILGSLPGAVSLKKNEYYANRLNRFWEILFSVMGVNAGINLTQTPVEI